MLRVPELNLHLTGNRYFGSSKRVAPAIGLLLLPPHSPVRVNMPVRIIADRLVIHNNFEADAGLHGAFVQLKSCFALS
jgi:hypothetical protein